VNRPLPLAVTLVRSRVVRQAVTAVVCVAAVWLLWTAFLSVFHVSPLVGKGPMDVWNYLVSGSGAGGHRSALGGALLVTLRDAGVGLVAGLVLGAGVAVLFHLFRPVEQALMPLVMVVRAVPLVALLPVIVLLLGRGLLGVTAISAAVVFFPTLVSTAFGLRAVPAGTADLLRCHGAGRWSTLRVLLLPSALPSLLVSARISMPGAMVGGLLAEWLATGQGLGYRLQQDVSTFEYTDMWAGVSVLSLTSLLLYAAMTAVERQVLARLDPARGA